MIYGLIGLSLAALFWLWCLQAGFRVLLWLSLICLLGLGFLHAPISSTNMVFWVQEGLFLATTLALVWRKGIGRALTFLPFLLSFALILLLAMPGSLYRDSIFVFTNGTRRLFVAPSLMLLGGYLAHRAAVKTYATVLLWAVFLQLPASLLLASLWTGRFMDLPGPDILTGTFGRGGSGFVVIIMSAGMSFALYELLHNRLSLRHFIPLSLSVLFLVSISDLKFLWATLPVGLATALAVTVLRKRHLFSKRMLLASTAGVVILLGLTAAVDRASERYHGQEVGLSSLLDYEFIKQSLYVQEGGVYEGRLGQPSLSRYGAVLNAWRLLSAEPELLALGYGIGSTNEGFGMTTLRKNTGFGQLDASAVSVLFFEIGLLGMALYLSPLLLLCAGSGTVLLRKSTAVSPELNMLSALVFLYGVQTIMSLPYNIFVLTPRGGGLFWLMAGTWIVASRVHRQDPDGLAPLAPENRFFRSRRGVGSLHQ